MEFIGYIFALLPYFLAVMLAGFVVVFVFFSFRSLQFGMASVFSLFLFNAVFPAFAGINIGIRLDALDLITLLLGSAALLRFIGVREARHGLLAWYVFVLAVLSSLAYGLASLGTAGGVAARPYFYTIVCTSYVLTFAIDGKAIRALLGAMVWSAAALLCLVVLRWAITYLPISALLPVGGRFASIESSLLRVVPSAETALMAQVVVIGIFYATLVPTLRWVRAFVPVLFLTVILLQHRSVWVALLAAVAARFTLPQAGRKATVQLAAMALVLAVLAIPLLGSGKLTGVTADVGRSASRALALTDTINFRFDSWRFAVGKWANSGALGLTVGLPMGTSMDRVIRSDQGNYSRVSVSAHNFYVQTLFNTGLLGILSIISVYVFVVLNLLRGLRHAELGQECSAMLLIIILQLTYYVAYGTDFVQGLILGVAAGLAITVRATCAQAGPVAGFGIRPLQLKGKGSDWPAYRL